MKYTLQALKPSSLPLWMKNIFIKFAPVKILLSISLSICLLLQSLQLNAADLLSLGELVEHVEMHSEKYGDSFFEFLTMHYGSQKHEHYDSHSEHEELPFNQNSSSTWVSAFVLDHQELPALRLAFIPKFRGNYYYSEIYSSLQLEDIFQPPRNYLSS